MHGIVTAGGRQPVEGELVGFEVLNDRAPPVIVTGPSSTTLPPLKVTFVPFPMLRPPGQSTHQFPETGGIVPDGLQLWLVVHRENVALGMPLGPMRARRLSR